jgi:hypothetical protein
LWSALKRLVSSLELRRYAVRKRIKVNGGELVDSAPALFPVHGGKHSVPNLAPSISDSALRHHSGSRTSVLVREHLILVPEHSILVREHLYLACEHLNLVREHFV